MNFIIWLANKYRIWDSPAPFLAYFMAIMFPSLILVTPFPHFAIVYFAIGVSIPVVLCLWYGFRRIRKVYKAYKIETRK